MGRAARQLDDLPRGLPLVIVLSNPAQADVDLDPWVVWGGLYDESGPLAGNRADHVSAVAILGRRSAAQDWAEEKVRAYEDPADALAASLQAEADGTLPEGERLFMTVLPTVSAAAAPLPPNLFAGPDDRVWRGGAPDLPESSP